MLNIHTGATLDRDHSLAVSFGGRPEGFENTVGQFANPLPVKIPIQEHFLADPGSPKNTLASLVTSVSRNVSQVKKAERLSMLDLARHWRTNGQLGQFHSPQVAVSFAPALADKRCRLFPVEGRWDLFFVFQDGPDAVELGVNSFLYVSIFVTCTPSGADLILRYRLFTTQKFSMRRSWRK